MTDFVRSVFLIENFGEFFFDFRHGASSLDQNLALVN
jgi:hypothetical protein